jgi:uncharacterized protein YcfL
MLKKGMLLLLICILFEGCGGVVTNVMDAKLDGTKNIIINDGGLNRQISFGEFKKNGAEVQVELQNRTKRDVSFEYRFIWYDTNGIEMSTLTNWNPATLTGMESRGFKSTPPSDAAAGFKMMIRRPHAITPY